METGARRFGLKSLSLAQKFYLTLVVPLVVMSGIVVYITWKGLDNNASALAEALRIQGKSNNVLTLLLKQDDASKAILLAPEELATFSEKKIGAYDEHKKLLSELKAEVVDKQMGQLLIDLALIDETKLRPVDTRILETLFENADQARSLYFSDYMPHRIEYETKIQELVRLGSEGTEKARAEMSLRNNWSLILIGFSLTIAVTLIALAIRILSKQIEISNENTRSLLAVLGEGLFFFDRNGQIAPERSQALGRIIPGADSVLTLAEFVGKYSTVTPDNVTMCLKLLWNTDDSDFLSDFDSTITFLPRSLSMADGRIVHVEYRPLNGKSGKLEKVVVVAADVTEKLKNEKEAVMQAERVRKISRVAAGPESYMSFFEESSSLFERASRIFMVTNRTDQELSQLKRDLHTLKGSLGTFGFAGLAQDIHSLETLLEEKGPAFAGLTEPWNLIQRKWLSETEDIETVLGLKGQIGKVSIPKYKFERIANHASAHKDDRLHSLVEDSLRVPISEALGKYQAYLAKFTDRHPEKALTIAFDERSSEVAYTEIQSLDAAFVHIFRNCFDHGIEDKHVREEKGKSPSGTIKIRCVREAQHLTFTISDDGAGVNGEKLAQKAVTAGIWTTERSAASSFQEKIELVFAANLSSKDEVTEISGRGVGMDAVKAAVERLGGSVAIASQPGVGTEFTIRTPVKGTSQGMNPPALSPTG